jgi:cephalosporin hydroxylase
VIVATQDGTFTNLRWWDQMLIEGDQVIAQVDPTKSRESFKIILFKDEDEDMVHTLFEALNAFLVAGEPLFVIDEWRDAYEQLPQE